MIPDIDNAAVFTPEEQSHGHKTQSVRETALHKPVTPSWGQEIDKYFVEKR